MQYVHLDQSITVMQKLGKKNKQKKQFLWMPHTHCKILPQNDSNLNFLGLLPYGYSSLVYLCLALRICRSMQSRLLTVIPLTLC